MTIHAEILTIGRELLQGKTLNTNAKFLSEHLTQIGVRVDHHSSCDDVKSEILKALTLAFKRSDLVMVTGGLGPTPDDVTREAVAQFFQTDLQFHPAQYKHVLHFLRKIKRKTNLFTKREAYFPRIGKPILNQFGIALGFQVSYGGKLLIALPGVPRELESLYHHSVEKIIKNKFKQLPKMHGFSVSLLGMNEPEMMQKIGKKIFDVYDFEFGSYPMLGWLILRFRSKDRKMISKIKKLVSKKLKSNIYAWKDISVEYEIARLLQNKKLSIAFAESCTGGLLSKRITDVPGASSFFLGSIVSYANKTKEKFLSVSSSSLKSKGAVSKQVAMEMASGARKHFGSDIAISITGIAGPDGGTKLKPVGLVWIGFSNKQKTNALKVQFAGDRDRVRHSAAQRALSILYNHLK